MHCELGTFLLGEIQGLTFFIIFIRFYKWHSSQRIFGHFSLILPQRVKRRVSAVVDQSIRGRRRDELLASLHVDGLGEYFGVWIVLCGVLPLFVEDLLPRQRFGVLVCVRLSQCVVLNVHEGLTRVLV